MLKTLGRPDRQIAVYDSFGSAVAVAPDRGVPALPPSLPEVTEVITHGEVKSGFRTLHGRKTYTKGLPERFLALRRFFERYPE